MYVARFLANEGAGCYNCGMKIEKGQTVKVKINDISDQGQGIGHADGFTVFVNGAMPGDYVEAELTNVKKRYGFARIKNMLELSCDRRESPCPYSEECGGCVFMGYDYDAELRIKAAQVADKLKRLGGIDDPVINDIVGMGDPFRYRNKAVFQVGLSDDGCVSVGFNRQRTHDVIDCSDCIIQSPAAKAAADALREYLRNSNSGKPVRNMTVKTAFGTGEVMVVIGTDGGELQDIEYLVELMDEAVYETGYSLESLYVDDGYGAGKSQKRGKGGKNSKKLPEPQLIAGNRVINEQAGDLKFEISPRSFYQVNPVMMEALYDIVRGYVTGRFGVRTGTESGTADEDILDFCVKEEGQDKKGGTILDLYCGAGTIGLWCLERDAHLDERSDYFVLGIETEKQAVLDANRNAVINGVVNARYICDKAETALPELVLSSSDDQSRVDADGSSDNSGPRKLLYDEELYQAAKDAKVAIVDPPRSGCHRDLLDSLIRTAPEKIVYVSCDPATLARDIKILCGQGYRFEEATPVDMFPHTGHVETVVLLSHQKSTEYINEQHPEKNDHT